VAVLKEFGMHAKPGAQDGIWLEPVTPMKMAQSYSILATEGSAPEIGPGIKIPEGPSVVSSTRPKGVSIAPACLFLVNHLMRRLQPPEQRYLGPDKARCQPSIFIEKDKEGLWGIAYRADAFLLVRIRDTSLKEDQVLSMMLRVLPFPQSDSEPPPPTPDGLVFRRICIDSGLRATSTCPDVVYEPFFKGSEPSEWCPIRHELTPLRSHFR
jgi:hypothetical protein